MWYLLDFGLASGLTYRSGMAWLLYYIFDLDALSLLLIKFDYEHFAKYERLLAISKTEDRLRYIFFTCACRS
jgi:hypothetical protein